MMERWYVVTERTAEDFQSMIECEDDPAKARVWTLSKERGVCGWDTDSGFDGYGLTKTEAEFLMMAANEKLAREGRLAEDVAQ